MDLNSKEHLRTTVLLLILSRVVYTKGLSHNLQCVTDYESTINCTLRSNLSSDHAWLKLENEYDDEEVLKCPLSWHNDHFFCSAQCEAFADTDVYKIYLCLEEESCEPLDEEYSPDKNIKPKPPCCLTVKQNSSQHHFYWKSTYEDDVTNLPKDLKYELYFYQKGHFNESNPVESYQTTVTVQNDFKPDSEYVAKVRSSPNQVFKEGQWSEWSPEVHWRTQPPRIVKDKNPHVFSVKKLVICVCVLVPLFLSLCITTVKKWRQKAFIPTPEPYFHTLYTECHGDFKSWVIMEKTVDLPKTEKTSHIENIFACENIQEKAPSVPQGSGYANMSGPQCVLAEAGLPYEACTSELDSATSSCSSACLSSQSRSPMEWDSGCWLSSDRSLEQGHLWYCNDYCTLSSFQQSALGTASGLPKCGTSKIMGHDTRQEIHSICE